MSQTMSFGPATVAAGPDALSVMLIPCPATGRIWCRRKPLADPPPPGRGRAPGGPGKPSRVSRVSRERPATADGSRLYAAQTGVAGPHDGLGAAGYLQLGEDRRDMVLDGLGRELQAARDRVVECACGDEVEDLAFPCRQFREGHRSGPGGPGHEIGEPAGDPWAEDRLSRGDAADGAQDILLRGALVDVSAR